MREQTAEYEFVKKTMHRGIGVMMTFIVTNLIYAPFMFCAFFMPKEVSITLSSFAAGIIAMIVSLRLTAINAEERSYSLASLLIYYPIEIKLIRCAIYRRILLTFLGELAVCTLPMLMLSIRFNLAIFLGNIIALAVTYFVISVLVIELNLRRISNLE